MRESSQAGTMTAKSSLAQGTSAAVLRVENMERAKRFYSETLGLEVKEATGPTAEVYVSTGQGTGFGLYERPGMPAPQNTALGFEVADFQATFEELRERGVRFEEYDIPEIGLKTENGVAELGGDKVAFFKDSEDNILALTKTR